MTVHSPQAIAWSEILASCRQEVPDRVSSSTALLANRTIAIETDDVDLFEDFFAAFGGSPPQPSAVPDAFIRAVIRCGRPDKEYGNMSLRRDGQPLRVDEVFFGLELPECPFEVAVSADGHWREVRTPGDPPLFAFRDDVCLFRKTAGDWRTKLMSVLYRGALRLREDLIFFHASALSITGKGVLLVGRKMAGKSTTALAIAARGHAILSDSCACYAPATGELVPFRRPVGIRQGPRARAVDEALTRNGVRSVRRDQSFRVDLATLLPPRESGPVRTFAIFFLRGFAPVTRIAPLKNDTAELANLRPIYSSFANAPHTQRAFELIRLFSRARLYALWPGNPDEAARAVEEVLR